MPAIFKQKTFIKKFFYLQHFNKKTSQKITKHYNTLKLQN